MSGRTIPVDVTQKVLHEAAYKCANPRCRYPITLDRHHLIPYANGGPNTADNLLALCPNCHADHHAGRIPDASLRAWKMLLVTVNEAYDRRTVDLLLALHLGGPLALSGGECAPLIASHLATVNELRNGPIITYMATLNDKGKLFIEGWIKGDQAAAIPDSFA